MSDSAKQPGLVCPHCGWPVAVNDRFCEECTKPLPDAAKPAAAPSDPPLPRPSAAAAPSAAVLPPMSTPASSWPEIPPSSAPVPPVSSHPQVDAPPTFWRKWQQRLEDVENIISGKHQDTPPARGQVSAPSSSASTAPVHDELLLEVDTARAFLEDLHITLRARLYLPKGGSNQLEIQAGWGGDGPESTGRLHFKRRLHGLEGGRWREIAIDWRIPVGSAGQRVMRWEIIFDGRRYEGVSEHTVCPVDADASDLRNVVLNIQQGHAGDINIGKFLEGARGMSPRELIDYVAKCPPQWKRVDLWKIGCFGPPSGLPPAPAEARATPLTLRLGQRCLHLLAAETAKLGRNRDNDIVLRCYDSAGVTVRQTSLQISGYHATLSRDYSGAVSFHDHSANGTLQNGVFLNQAKASLQPDQDYRLGVGADVAAQKAVLELTAQIFRCCVPLPDHRFCPQGLCSRREACGLLLRRMDDVNEDYALVWCHLELSSCRPGWPNLSVWRFPEGLAWRMEEKSGWLYPGASIALPGGTCHVEAFKQIGL